MTRLAWLWDCGIWADPTGRYTGPRILAALRDAEASGLIKIIGLRHFSIPGPPQLKYEDEVAYNHRRNRTSAIRKKRVKDAAKLLDYSFTDDTDADNIEINDDIDDMKENRDILLPSRDHPCLFFVVMPDSQERVCLIKKLLNLDPNAQIVIVPPVFENADKLECLKDIDDGARIVPFLPYRYSLGMRALRKEAEQQSLTASVLTVTSGPYPRRSSSFFRAFVNEFCLPALDCLIYEQGLIEMGTLIYKETEAGLLPVILCDLIHEAGRVSSVVLSATANFQEVNFGLKALFNRGVTLDLTQAFQQIILQGGADRGKQFTESGHDASGFELNGYSHLLSNIITQRADVPTLETFCNTQVFVDRIFQALDKLPPAESGHPQQTQI